MSGGFSNPSWFPQPPPRPLKATPAVTLLFGAVVCVVAGIAAIVVISSSPHSDRKTPPAATRPTPVSSAAAGSRQAFAECLQSMGANAGTRGRGRLGRSGPSRNFRTAVDVCRSLVEPAEPEPAAPAGTGAATPPVA
jgi:hypothetical protein